MAWYLGTHEFDIGDVDFSELKRVELAAPIAVAPIEAAPVAAAPVAGLQQFSLRLRLGLSFADGDDIVQQALAEAIISILFFCSPFARYYLPLSSHLCPQASGVRHPAANALILDY